MNAHAGFHIYLVANLLLILAPIVLLALTRLRLDWRTKLLLHYSALVAVIGLAVGQQFLPKRVATEPIAKTTLAPAHAVHRPPVVHAELKPSLTEAAIDGHLLMILLATSLALFFVVKVGRELRQLLLLRAGAYSVRTLGGVEILLSEEVDVPLCFWWPGALTVVVPYHLIGKTEFRIAVLHELQHHRQGDTKSVYALAAFKSLFCVNPAVHFWSRWISAVQELACDSALVGHKKIEPLVYANCLVQIAENLVGRRSLSAGAAARTFLTNRNTIHGRIQEMFKERKTKTSGATLALAVFLVGGLLSATAFAARGTVVDRHVTLAEAQDLLSHSAQGGGFPVVVNERVVKWLNNYVGTAEGRRRMSEALERMPTYKPMIERRLKEYGLPPELLAIPLIESGYRNLPSSSNAVHSAGLWQFIAGTAINFGLQVDSKVDERLDVEKETDAALRLLYSDKLRFDDWGLSILAYNAGESFVQKEIAKTGSRDAWTLIESGGGSDETNDYLPRLMTAILILRNPSILD